MSKVGPILSIIGGIWIIIFSIIMMPIFQYIADKTGFIILFLSGISAVIGFALSFKYTNIGSIILLITGLIYPIYSLIIDPFNFIFLFLDFLGAFYITIPLLLLLIGGIISLIEWLLGRKKRQN